MSSCENDIKVVQNLGKSALGVEEAKNIVTYWSTGGKVKAKLTAPFMYRYLYDTPRVVFPKNLHVDFFDSAMHVESQLFAKYGRYLESENKVFLRDSVIVFNVLKDTLRCNELYWDQNKGIFYTDKPVRITKHDPMQRINGTGLIADQNFKWFTIKDAKGPVLLPDSVL
jgi:LPS export ABC transporter protein LptC